MHGHFGLVGFVRDRFLQGSDPSGMKQITVVMVIVLLSFNRALPACKRATSPPLRRREGQNLANF